MKKNIFTVGVMMALLATNVHCQSPKESKHFETYKVDFDFAGRKVEEVNDPTYQSWTIEEGTTFSHKFGNATVSLQGKLRSGWYKVGVHAPYYAQLVNDGAVAEDSLTLTISGLAAGEHSLLTFHNTFDNPDSKTFSPVAIYVDGEKIKTIKPSNRATATIESAMAYFKFKAQQDKPVAIVFKTVKSSSANTNELVINGFELDGANMMLQARNPFPNNHDEHVVTDNQFKLQWEAPKNTKEHQLYISTDENVVEAADKSSDAYQGALTVNEYALTNLYSRNTYFWRVDEVAEDGEITKGEVWSFRPAQLAFPGAEGYGRFALGGRGGKVVEVTNLNDDGPGSLREAVNNDIGPRTIVFTVSGTIELKSRLVINQPYVTLAGQTAPGKGITITRAPMGLTGDDGVVRFVRVRIGAGRTFDGMGLTGANHSIIDHCSISWTIDESFSSRGAHNITLQRTLISEALNVANHGKYEKGKMHGYAATIGGDIGSFHHNLLAHNYGRNWSLGGGLNGDGYYSGRLDIRNNVVYNWGHRTTDGGAFEVNFVNNYYKSGAATDIFYALTMEHEGVGLGSQRAYFDGNVMPGYFNEKNQKKGRRSRIKNDEIVDYETFVDEPFFESYVTTQTASQAYKMVLSDVGANQPLDNHDQRIIGETLKGTYTFKGSKSGLPGMIDTEADAGGWEEYPEVKRSENWDTDHDGLPDWWEKAKGLEMHSKEGDFSDTNQDEDHDGFTQLDDYLDWLSHPHFLLQKGETVQLSLQDLFRGFTQKPMYTIETGNAQIHKDELQIQASKSGFSTVKVSVKDKDGDTMTRTINVYVE